MPSTISTEETFPAGVPEARIEEERDLRIAAGAIRSEYSGSEEDGWILRTEWNVIGQ